jgi:hypothetical protein
VTIQGNRFIGANLIDFSNALVPLTPAEFSNDLIFPDTQINILGAPPAATAGTGDVTVTTPCGTSSTGPDDQFTYFYPVPNVTGVLPASGSTDGGTLITITGVGFTGATVVSFVSATTTLPVAIRPDDDNHITVSTPAATDGGPVDVLVTTPGGTSVPIFFDQFLYTPAPAVSFVVLVDPAATAAQFSQLQGDVQSGGGTVEQTTPSIMLVVNGSTATQETLFAETIVIGFFSADAAPAINSLLGSGADPAAIVNRLSGLTPTGTPAQPFRGDDEDFDISVMGQDDEFNPVPDRPFGQA